MDKKELKEVLIRLGWTQAELARRVGKSQVSVSRWRRVPGCVVAYLRLYESVSDALE
jgi:predicted transcriptional regulator